MEGMKMLGKVVHFKKSGEPGEPYPLMEGQTSIGAHRDADIRLKIRDPNLEDVHCIIDVQANGTAIILNKSIRDPVRINAVTVRRDQILKDHDIFEICNKKFQYRKCVSNSAHKSFKESASKKRYTLSTNSTTKTRLSLLTKTPQPKRTSSASLMMKRLSRTVPRKSIAKPRPSRKLNTTFESHSFSTSLIKPDIKNASVEVSDSMSKSVSAEITEPSRSSKRLSQGSSARLGSKRLSNKATPSRIQRKSLVNSAIKKVYSTNMEDEFTEEVLAEPLETLNKSVESDTISVTDRRSKRTPKLLRYSSNRTPVSFKVSSGRKSLNKTPTSVTRNSIRKSPKERGLSCSTEFDRESLDKTRSSKMQSLNSSSPTPEHRVSSKRRSSLLNASRNNLSGVEELFIITSSDSSSLYADNHSDAEQYSSSSLPSLLESDIEGNVSAKLTLSKSANSMNQNDRCPSGEESLGEERLLPTTPRSEPLGQYSLISPSVRSSARIKKIPKKYDNTVCCLISFDGTSKSETDIKSNLSTPKVGVLQGVSRSLTPQHSHIDIKTPKSIGKHDNNSFVESTPIPKSVSHRISMNISKNSAIQQSGEECSSKMEITPQKGADALNRTRSRLSQHSAIMTEITPQKGADAFKRTSSRLSEHSATSHSINRERSIGSARKMRSSLTLPSSPLDSVIVNVDSDSCIAEESVVSLLTPKERTSSLRHSKLSRKSSPQIVDTDSVMFTTPENNMSVVEISDAVTPSPAQGKRSKSLRTSSTDMNTTPKNIPQEEAGFKTPLTTPALFENLKNSALRSRKRLNKSLVKSIRMSAEEEEDSGETSSDSEKRTVEHSGRLLTRSMSNNSDVPREEDNVPTTGVKRGRESCGSVRKTSKKAKLAVYSDQACGQRLDLSSSSSTTSEMMNEDGNSQTRSTTSMKSILNSSDYLTSINRSRLSLAAPRRKRSIIRHSLQNINICTTDRQSHSNTSNAEPSLQSSSCHSLDTSVSPVEEPAVNEINADWQSDTVSSLEASHISCQSSNDSMNMSGARRSIRTSNLNKSPVNNLSSIKGEKKLLRTPRSPLNDLTDVAGIGKLMRTPKQQKSPLNDLTKVHGVKRLMKTPKQQKSPLNDLTKMHGIKKLMKTPRQQKSPLNDLTKVHGIKKLMKTPKQQKSPLNDLTKVHGIKKLMKTPKQQNSPVNDLTNVRGVKKLMATPREVRSPKNDLTDVPGVKKLMSTPKEQKTPHNDLSDVTGVKQLFTTRKVQKSPLNDLTDVKGVKELLKSPKIVRAKQIYQQKSPRNDLTNVAGVKQLMRTPKLQKSPKNDLANIPNLRKFVRTPRLQKQPSNDLTDVEGVKRLYLNEEAAVRRKSAYVAGIETLFQVNEDIENVDLFSNMHKKPLRTYRGKTLTPSKSSEVKEQGRKTLGDIPTNSPHVEKWVEEQIRFINMQTKEGEADGPASEITSHPSKEHKLINECSASETPSLNASTSVPKTRSRRKPIVSMVDSPRRTTRKKQLVVEMESMGSASHEAPRKELIQLDTDASKIPEKSIQTRSRRGRKLYQVENEPVDNKELHEGENPAHHELPKRTRRNMTRGVTITKQEKITEESPQSKRRRKVPEYSVDQTEKGKDIQAGEVSECTDSLPKKRLRRKKQAESPLTSESSEKEEQNIVVPKTTRTNKLAERSDSAGEVKAKRTRRNKLAEENDSVGEVKAKRTRRKGRETPTIDEKENDGPVKSKRNQKEAVERDPQEMLESHYEIKETVEKPSKKRTRNVQENIVVASAESEAMARPNRRGRPRKDAAVSKTEEGHSSECTIPVRSSRRNRKNATEHSETKDPEVRLERLKGGDNVETVSSARSMRNNRRNRVYNEEKEEEQENTVPEPKSSRRAKKIEDKDFEAPIRRTTRRKH